MHKAEEVKDTRDGMVQIFEEVEIAGETFCLVPKNLSRYVPRAQPDVIEICGVGKVEVGEDYAYVPENIISKVEERMANSVDLQHQGKRCRNLMWEKYGKSGVPPFEPEAMKETCHALGAIKRVETIVQAISTDDQSNSK